MGMAGVLFAAQLDDPILRATVILMCMGVPLFVGGNVLARYSMDLTQRVVLLVGMVMLVVGSVYTELGYAAAIADSEEVSYEVSRIAQYIGLGSLLLGLFAVLYSVIRSHAVLNELSEQFRHISEHMAEGLILTGEEGHIVLVNTTFAEMAGIPKEELIGESALVLANRLGAETMVRHTKHREAGVASEYQVSWSRNGEEHQYWINGTPIYDRRGRRVGALATVRDITERQRMANQLEQYAARLQHLVDEQTQRLRSSEHRLRNLLVHMNEGFVTLDANHCIRFVNESICRLLGAPADQLAGTRLSDFIGLIDRHRFERHLHSVNEQGNSAPAQEYSLQRKDGGHLAVNISIAPVEDDRVDGPVWSLVVSDVQALKSMQHQLEVRARQLEEANEELRRLDRAKDVFLSNVSHELRTPLSTVQGYVEMWELGDLGPVSGPQAGALRVMGRNIDRLTRLINEMIEFSRMEITGVRIYRTLFSIRNVVEECAGSIEPFAMQKSISISAFTPESLPEIWGDREKLSQVLAILLSNAMKFSREGALVQVRVDRDGEAGVSISVSDTGIGIAPEDQARVFEKFFQIDSSYTRQYQGTGIGLSIAQSIVEAHGGSIELASEPKRGSTFTIRLPGVVFQRSRRTESSPELEGTRVMLAAEHAEFRETVATYLRGEGCKVETCASGHECVRAAQEHTPDVVLVDETLVDMPGADLTPLMREGLATNTTPILMFTSDTDGVHSDQQIFDRIWELKKPFSAEQLALKILKVSALSGEIGEAWVATQRKDVEPRVNGGKASAL
jgi:PAS domain S-box-containing protein